MNPVEARLAHPFYLKMMGLNALESGNALWGDLVRAAHGATEEDVKLLLGPEHWRPVVMGAWFSLKFERDEVGGDLLHAIGLCGGTLTAPPLAVAATIVIGEDAATALLDYIERDLERRSGAAGFVAATIENLGAAAPIPIEDRDRDALAKMLAFAREFRSAVTGERPVL